MRLCVSACLRTIVFPFSRQVVTQKSEMFPSTFLTANSGEWGRRVATRDAQNWPLTPGVLADSFFFSSSSFSSGLTHYRRGGGGPCLQGFDGNKKKWRGWPPPPPFDGTKGRGGWHTDPPLNPPGSRPPTPTPNRPSLLELFLHKTGGFLTQTAVRKKWISNGIFELLLL